MATQIPLNKILPALDAKDREFYDNLTDEEKKAFSGYLMLRYCSAVRGDPDFEHYYIMSTNECANKHMFDLAKHPKLQWLMLTAASPGFGKQNHVWLKQKPKPKNATGPLIKQLMELYPAMKEDDIVTLSNFVTAKDIKEYLKDRGEE